MINYSVSGRTPSPLPPSPWIIHSLTQASTAPLEGRERFPSSHSEISHVWSHHFPQSSERQVYLPPLPLTEISTGFISTVLSASFSLCILANVQICKLSPDLPAIRGWQLQLRANTAKCVQVRGSWNTGLSPLTAFSQWNMSVGSNCICSVTCFLLTSGR